VRDVLFLSQRIPYPPNKGDKIRSWHFFEHFARTHRVHLGCFVDDPADEPHVPMVEALCASSLIRRIQPRLRRIRSLAGLATGEALTLPYFRDAALSSWVSETIRRCDPELVFVFSSAAAQYVPLDPGDDRRFRCVVDMVDVDSAKWRQYAERMSGPLRWIYRREGERLLAFERAIALRADRTLFVSRPEADLFRRLAPETADRVDHVDNGVDLAFFRPADPAAATSPFPPGKSAIVFTGMMDYWPNVDAVTWFADAVWPEVRRHRPDALFAVVGANPGPAVTRLAERDGSILVTGRVPDIRPYLAHAAIAVAPLRVARGVQNKVLEAMAMAKVVVASPQALEGIDAMPGRDLLVAEEAEAFAAAVIRQVEAGEVARGALGAAARRYVLGRHHWSGNLTRLSRLCFGDTPVAAPGITAALSAE
jgi:sugar transferase (PEP-CTERM/EpsH1 system associated)